MNCRALATVLAAICLLSSCATSTDEKSDNANTLVSGEIVHVQGEPHTYQGDFVFTEESHAVVTLFYSISAGGDAPVEAIAEMRIEDVSSFPIPYRIEGDPVAVFAEEGDYFLHAAVMTDAGDERYVGDLINEVYTPVYRPGTRVRIEVTGLERCGTPDSGGFCTNRERP